MRDKYDPYNKQTFLTTINLFKLRAEVLNILQLVFKTIHCLGEVGVMALSLLMA